jgi:hypothetical protein
MTCGGILVPAVVVVYAAAIAVVLYFEAMGGSAVTQEVM